MALRRQYCRALGFRVHVSRFRVERLRFGVESFTRNVVSPHRGAERAQLRVETHMRKKAEDGREGTVASGFGTRGGSEKCIWGKFRHSEPAQVAHSHFREAFHGGKAGNLINSTKSACPRGLIGYD